MPLIVVEAEHPSKEQKERLIEELTAKAGEILQIPPAGFYVLVKENDSDNWGIGGQSLTERRAAQ